MISGGTGQVSEEVLISPRQFVAMSVEPTYDLETLCKSMYISPEFDALLREVSINNISVFVSLIQHHGDVNEIMKAFESIKQYAISRVRNKWALSRILDDWKRVTACAMAKPEFAKQLAIKYIFDRQY